MVRFGVLQASVSNNLLPVYRPLCWKTQQKRYYWRKWGISWQKPPHNCSSEIRL